MQANASVIRRGFTLIELLIVVVVIGILAAIAIPKFNTTKGKSYASSMKSDLRNLASQQEDFFYFNERYAGDMADVSFDGSPGVVLTISEASVGGWSAVATHPAAAPMTCAVYFGTAAPLSPAVVEGVVNCE
jgi:prepilin-type N-terminal cleavage/methylation domain-containing protein